MATELYTGTETVSTTEWSLTTDTSGPDADTTAGTYQPFIDFNAVAAGDLFQIRLYEKDRSGDTQRLVNEWFITGAQANPIWTCLPHTLLNGWDFTLKKISGTDRLITWDIRDCMANIVVASVTGSVGSVTGAVGSVTGAVGSVTGAVGSVTGAVGSVTGAVGSVTGNVGGNVTGSVGSVIAAGIAANTLTTACKQDIADFVLDRNMATGTDSGTDSTIVRTPRQALRAIRNKVSQAAGVATITKEDDVTASWTTALTTAAGNPLSGSDPT